MCAPVSYLLIGPLPEDSESEDSCDGWGKAAGHRLDIDVQLAAVGGLQDGDPHHTHHHQDHSHNPGSNRNSISVSFSLSAYKHLLP